MLPKEESQKITQEMDVAWKEHEKFIESLEKEAIAHAEQVRLEKQRVFFEHFPYLKFLKRFVG